MSAPRRGALVGFGGVAEHGHVPGWLSDPRFEIAAVVEPVAEGRERARKALGDVAVYADLASCLEAERLAFLDVASPPAFHLAAIEAAAGAGLHVLVEKPLALDPGQAARAQEAARNAGVALLVVHNWHHAPVFRAARQALAEGAIGTPHEVTFTTERTEPASGGGASWRLERELAGGGILVDHGWHQLYVARALLGGAEPVAVTARIETRRWHEASVEDTAHADVLYAGGERARLRLTWAAEARRTHVEVKGDAGSLQIEDGRVLVEPVAGAARDWPVEPDAADDSYHATWFPHVLDAFALALGEPAHADENLREAHLGQAVIDAAYRSGRAAGARIELSV